MVGEHGHAEDGVEDEAEEMREGGVRDAVLGPGTVVVHFGDASVGMNLRQEQYYWFLYGFERCKYLWHCLQ